MKFEYLPNEILLELFAYMNGTDLLYAFYGLNLRLNLLLCKQHRIYWFNFSNVSKRTFDIVCRQHILPLRKKIFSIQLDDSEETTGEIKYFCSYVSSFSQFIHLKSLTICDSHSPEFLLKLTEDCQYLPDLTNLRFQSCTFYDTDFDIQLMIDNIWNLPKLTNCYLDIDTDFDTVCIPTVISLSLHSLTFFPGNLQLNEMYQLFDRTPRLKNFCTYIGHLNRNVQPLSSFVTLIQLKLSFISNLNVSIIAKLFQNMPNLHHLDVNISTGMINGYQWEAIIRKHLPKLKRFLLDMKIVFNDDVDIQDIANDLIESFRGSFWILEHLWFVRCITWKQTLIVKTLSNQSKYVEAIIPDSWQSTYPDDHEQKMFNSMTYTSETFFNSMIPSYLRLSNINSLYIKLPIPEQFWTILPNINRIKSLSISSYSEIYSSQVQLLLDQIPVLNTLTIRQDQFSSSKILLSKYLNTSVRRIDLHDCRYCFNNEECLILSRSSLFRSCEILLIRINRRYGIVHFIENMFHLRTLSVRIQNDEFFRWL